VRAEIRMVDATFETLPDPKREKVDALNLLLIYLIDAGVLSVSQVLAEPGSQPTSIKI